MYRKQLCMFALGLALVFAAGASAELGQGKVLIEYWFGNGVDSNLDNLKANAAFPDNPASSEWLDAFERADWANMDYWAGRLRAYLTPPQTGEYTFWTSSDDDSEVWLSTDDTAANAKLICSVEGWTGYRNYAGTEGVVGPNQKSAAIALEAGKRYYIEGLFTDGTGGGHMSVGWAGPGIGDVATPIGSAYVTALIRDPEPLFGPQNPEPADGTLDWLTPVLKWKSGMFAAQHKIFFGTTPELTDANFKMVMPGNLPMFPVPELLVPGTTYYWRVDEVEATGVRTGPVWSFTVMPLTAHFPNPVDGAMYRQTNITVSWTAGQNADKYKVYGGEDQAAVAAGDAKALLAEQVDTSLDASALLQPGKTYYWRVDTIDLSGVLQAGPVWTFSTYDPAGGAVAQYWPNKFLAGEPNVVTTVGEVNFNWPGAVPGVDSPDALIPVDNFSCRWTAELNIPVTGTYKFYAASDDGARMFLNGKVLTNFWVDRGTTENASADIELVAGQRYQIVMEMYEAGGGASAYLRWSGPGIAKEIIPQGILQPPAMAFSPSPANGATGLVDTTKLSWTAGKGAAQHNLYLGTDEALVAEGHASVSAGTLTETSFDPGLLPWGATLYWKVDEVAADGTVVPGLVWSFTVMDSLVIDDFEAYDLEPATPVNAAIGWWKLNGDLVDSSGKGHDGKMIGTGGFEDDAVMGKVLDLPGGDNQYVEIGAVGISGNMPTTIACWAKADNTNIPDWTLIFGFTGDATGAGVNGSHFNIDVIGGPGGVGAHCWGWEETIFTDQESLEWHHYAMTYDGTTIRYFGDGFARDTDPGKSNVQNLSVRGDRVFIGKRVTAANSFPGNIADARVYDYALSPTEIMSVAGVVPTVLVTDAWKPDGIAAGVTADVVHQGGQALKLAFDNAAGAGKGSVTFAFVDGDLTRGGAEVLSLWLKGDPTNAAEPVFVALTDAAGKVAVAVDPDPTAVQMGVWWKFNVPLAVFAGVDLAKVATLTIGVGDGVPGGAGTIYIDDIRIGKPGLVITKVVRAGGQSGTRTDGSPINGAYTGDTAPVATQAGGLKDGNFCFSDRNYPWAKTPFAMTGSDYVLMFNNDKSSSEKDVTYTVTFSRPTIVWITVDDRIPAEWVDVASPQAAADLVAASLPAGTFVDTGLNLYIHENATTDRPMSVFAAELVAGTYVFGGMWSNKNYYTIGAIK